MDLTTYFENFEATKKVVEKLNNTARGYPIVKITYKEQHLKVEVLGPKEATRFIVTDKKRILGV